MSRSIHHIAAILALCVVLVTAPGVTGAQSVVTDAAPSNGADGVADPSAEDPAWNETIGGAAYDGFAAVTRSGDGGYVAAGFFDANAETGSTTGDAWLVKFDGDGNVVWNRTFADGAFTDVVRTDDGGYLAVGTRSDPVEGDFDRSVGLAVKYSADGVMEWSETYGNPEDDVVLRSAAETSDGGYVLAGTSLLGPQIPTGNATNAYFVRVDGDGTVQWERGYGQAGSADGLQTIHRTDDGTYAFFGSSNFASAKWVGAVASDGSIVQNRTIDNPSDFSPITDAVQTDDGYTAFGHVGLIRGEQVHVVSMDGNLNTLSSETVDVPSNVSTQGATTTADGGYAVAVWNWTSEESVEAGVLKLDGDGNREWLRGYRESNGTLAYDVVASGDGSLVVVGQGIGPGGDGWIAEVGSSGDDGGDETLTVAEAIAGEDGVVGDQDLQRAIQLWASKQPVPDTGGETIDNLTLQQLIQLWASGSEVGN